MVDPCALFIKCAYHSPVSVNGSTALLGRGFWLIFAKTYLVNITRVALILCACVAISVSCKKNKEVSRDEQLKGTAWAGEYQYTSILNQTPQAFSIELNADSTVTWHDVDKSENGTWVAKGGGQIQLTFSTGKVMADLSTDSSVTFANITMHNWKINSLYRSAVPTETALQNTTWKGKLGSNNYTLNILPGKKITFLVEGFPVTPEAPYDIAGAGIKFTIGTVRQYAGFIHSNLIKGTYYNGSSIGPYNATKQ
jgi:hypothetical protein